MLKSVRWIKTQCHTRACAGPIHMTKIKKINDVHPPHSDQPGHLSSLISFYCLHVEILTS